MKTTKPSRSRRSQPSRTAPKPGRSHALVTKNNGPQPNRSFPIVGIGASAGGLEAMTELLKQLPARTGMAFVLVQHLDPTHESALTSLLSRLTAMPVTEAKPDQPLRPNQMYVIPPNRLMTIAGRKLKLAPRRDTDAHLVIDEFLRALAAEEGSQAVGVILSGNGADGTQGLLAIKAAGGLTFAQEEKSAKYPAMPGNAITAGCVDFVLSPERIARELGRIAGHPYVTPPAEVEDTEPGRSTENRAFEDILMLLRQRTAVDFAHYKHATLQRRIQRRMVLHKLETPEAYVEFLRVHANEVTELFSDILIHVTGFFRDAKVFQALKKRLFPRMVKNKTAEEAIRIWVPGCSTGEEVYSIAISMLEFLGDRRLQHSVQIFGTDIHEGALEKARAGSYLETIRADVSPERLRRFFVRTQSGYRVSKAVRELCIFARHNVVADPPFSNLDLISCRNVMIYLGPLLQRKVIPLFHYALKPNSLLLLGASESVGGFADLFSLHDRKSKVYVKKSTHLRPAVSFIRAVTSEPYAADAGLAPSAPMVTVGPTLTEVQKQADRILLTNYSPAGVIINRQLEVLQFRGRTSDFLEHPHGEASLNLFKMAREGLMPDLRAAINKAFKEGTRVCQAGLRVKSERGLLEVSVDIVPYSVPLAAERFLLVLFHAAGTAAKPAGKKVSGRRAKAARKESDGAGLSQLREELAATRHSLEAIIEEQDATNEELRSANEEIMSSNEELQSTNEELETAKEELQSTNEELTTLNDELESRNTELEHVNNDLHNVLGGVNIPILILGADLRIRRFTHAAEKLFNLLPGDVGRPLTDINLPLDLPNFSKLVLEVIDNLSTKELEAQDRAGHWWSVRIRPYKTADNKIAGAVIALVDIEVMRNSAQLISQGRAFADALINTMPRPVLLLDQDLCVQAANQAFYQDFSVSAEATLHRRIYALGDGQWDIPKLRTLLEEILPHNASFKDFEVEHNFPHIGRKRMLLEARRLALKGNHQHAILLTIDKIAGKESA